MKAKDLLFQASSSTDYAIQSISWWLTRTLLVQQRILDDRSSSLFDLLQVFMGDTLHHFGTLEKVTNYWGTQLHDMEPSDIVSMVHLEAGVLEYIYGRVDSCRSVVIDKFYTWLVFLKLHCRLPSEDMLFYGNFNGNLLRWKLLIQQWILFVWSSLDLPLQVTILQVL